MAQIQINADTDTKELSCSINGTLVPDIEDMNIYSNRDSNGNVNSLDVSLSAKTVTVDGVTVRVSYYASGSEKAQSAIASGQKVYNDMKDFVGIEDKSEAAKDIDDFLSSQKRSH